MLSNFELALSFRVGSAKAFSLFLGLAPLLPKPLMVLRQSKSVPTAKGNRNPVAKEDVVVKQRRTNNASSAKKKPPGQVRKKKIKKDRKLLLVVVDMTRRW